MKELDRRDFLKGLLGLGGLALTGVGFLACRATETPKANANPVPAETPTPIPAETPVAKELPAWPKTAQEAAKLFGETPDRWEVNPDGGWHLIEGPVAVAINPRGYLMEGYRDTKPGKNPDAFVTGIEISAQGGSIWPVPATSENARELQAKMAIPVWDDKTQHPARLVGFSSEK